MERGEANRPAGPVFVGGTGRCGTHAIAYLIGASGRHAQVPAELQLHAAGRGLPAFVDGDRSRRGLLGDLITFWWRRRPDWASAPLGAHWIAPRRRYLSALVRLATAAPRADRVAISRRFVRSLLDPLAPTGGAWVEKTPGNCASAGLLFELFPQLRLIHVVRDGRDVACSFMQVPWAPDDFAGALARWERDLLKAHRGTQEIPPERVHRLLLEDLVLRQRDRSYRELLEFLGVPDEPPLRSFFDRELTPARAHIGRWRSDLDPAEHDLAESLYRDSLERLGSAGVTPLPAPEAGSEADSLGDPGEEPSRSPIDPWGAAIPDGRGRPGSSF